MATRRPDLEMAPFKAPGYLTSQIFPSLFRAVRQGVLYWRDVVADSAAQTGRTAGAAPNVETVNDFKTAFNLENDEFIDRVKIPGESISGLGGLLPAQMLAARVGKRNVGEAIEDLTVANVLANASCAIYDIQESLIKYVEIAKDTVNDCSDGTGRIVLVCSSTIFGRIKRLDEIIDRMKYTGVMASGINDVRGISAAQLAAALNLDGVLVGPKTAWYDHSATYQDRAAIVVLPDGGVEPVEQVQLGRTIWFAPDDSPPTGDAMFSCESYYSDDLKSEIVDVQAYAEQHVLNPEMCVILDGIDEGNVVTTTTTTTT